MTLRIIICCIFPLRLLSVLLLLSCNSATTAPGWRRTGLALHADLLVHAPCKQIGMHSSSSVALSALQARAVRGALVVLFIDAMCVFLGLSVLAYFLEDLGGSVLELGSLFATFAIFNIAASTWSGYASDKLGRRPVLVVSTFGVSVGFLLTGTAQSVTWLFVARAWLGFWSGVASVGRAYIADVTSPSHRTDAMGKAGAVMMVGYAVGAPLGGDLRPSPAYRPQPQSHPRPYPHPLPSRSPSRSRSPSPSPSR